MKNTNKTNRLAIIASTVMMMFQTFSTTAHADYKGYWLDEVRAYEASHPHQDYQPAPQPYYPQEPVYQEPSAGYYQPAPQPYNNYAPAVQGNTPAAFGRASYYANEYQGRPTASGETYDMNALTAAHPNLPFGSMIRVTNVQNGRSVVVRVNDRGPFKPGRVVDLSLAAAQQIGLILHGSADVQVDVVG